MSTIVVRRAGSTWPSFLCHSSSADGIGPLEIFLPSLQPKLVNNLLDIQARSLSRVYCGQMMYIPSFLASVIIRSVVGPGNSSAASLSFFAEFMWR